MMRHGREFNAKAVALKVPTLVIWGEHDRILTPDIGDAIIQAQPGARLVKIPAAGHMPHQEQPEHVVQALREFLDESN
jgi:pimeloyl-ACP methyl ester carboxylesterase